MLFLLGPQRKFYMKDYVLWPKTIFNVEILYLIEANFRKVGQKRFDWNEWFSKLFNNWRFASNLRAAPFKNPGNFENSSQKWSILKHAICCTLYTSIFVSILPIFLIKLLQSENESSCEFSEGKVQEHFNKIITWDSSLNVLSLNFSNFSYWAWFSW